jgi:hypothetical protein
MRCRSMAYHVHDAFLSPVNHPMPPYAPSYSAYLKRRRHGSRRSHLTDDTTKKGPVSLSTHRASTQASSAGSTQRAGQWGLPQDTIDRIAEVVDGGWAKRTRKNHDGAVARYRVFCRSMDVPSELTLPTTEPVLCAWLASMYGRVSGSTARNDMAGLRAWHVRQNEVFPASERVAKILESIEHHRPATSRLPQRPPVTIDMVRVLVDALHPVSLSFALAVLACALVAFWGQFRLGELLPTSRAGFSSDLFPTQASWSASRSYKITLPWTKTTKSRGAVVRLPPQTSRTCAVTALSRYLRKFPASATSPLFCYIARDGKVVPLTKKAFLDHINSIWKANDFPRITGHAFRIGGTTELLRRGVDPDVVKVSGRWSSDSFLRYWRKTDEVLPQHLDNVVVSSRQRAAPRG